MASGTKKISQLAQQFFKLSLVDGRLSGERVAGVLAYIEKKPPVRSVAVLRAYQRLVAAEVARGVAVVEHAGPVSEAALQGIAAGMTSRYGRSVATQAKSNPTLLAGLRIRVGDDVFESSAAGQLGALAAAV